jgi:diguanylate cyclase (GGDEF)-like protein
MPSRRWRLRTGLLVPILVLVPLFVATTALYWEDVTRKEANLLVAQRQATALAGVQARLKERQQANQTISYLLAKRDIVEASLDSGNTLRLSQTLVLMQATLGVSYINVYTPNGARLLQIGGSGAERIDSGLVVASILGNNRSGVAVGDKGVVVAAANAVSGRTGISGVIVVGSQLPASDLRDASSGEEVAVFRAGHLVDTTYSEASAPIATALRQAQPDELNPVLAPLHVHAATAWLNSEGALVALVPVADLDQASHDRAQAVLGGLIGLMLTMIVVAVIQARSIARPVDSLVGVAGALVRGDYGKRVPRTGNYELHELGQAINHLAGELERKVTELTRQATHDPLSGLPNRVLFLRRVEQALSERRPGLAVAVLFLDLDNFKIVNDSLGHAAGDRLIVAVANRLRACVPATSTIARLGGDEFTVLMLCRDDDQTAVALGERLLTELRTPFSIDGHDLFVVASVGIALSTAGPSQAGELLRAADVAMYHAKNSGRGRCIVYDGSMGRTAAERLELETELRRAIEHDGLLMHYQPIVDLASGRIVEVEALVRWRHPRRGLMSPASFIPLAEESGLIVPLGRWVLRTACRQARVWRMQNPGLVVSANLSARELQQPDLADSVQRILIETGLPPGGLKLEITETVLMRDADAAQLVRLAELGVHLAIDDFGTGYSSLAYLSRLPIDTLKIDRSFVSRLGREPESDAVVRTIIALAHTLKLSVTAEGIETPEQAAQLRSLGAQRGQGYYFARPAPAELLNNHEVVAMDNGVLVSGVDQPDTDTRLVA